MRAAEPAFEPLTPPRVTAPPCTFAYRSREGETTTRHLEPWALTSRGGHWYVVGLRPRPPGRRSFRLSRIEGAVRRVGPAGAYRVPDDVDAAADHAGVHPGAAGRADGGAAGACRARRAPAAARAGDRAGSARRLDVVRVVVRRRRRVLAHELACYGPDVVAWSPPDLRAGASGALGGPLGGGHDLGERVTSMSGGVGRAAVPPAGHGALAAHPAGGRVSTRRPRHFGISQTQLVKDLELLFVCGTPGHLPDDLIEADWECGRVYLGNAGRDRAAAAARASTRRSPCSPACGRWPRCPGCTSGRRWSPR